MGQREAGTLVEEEGAALIRQMERHLAVKVSETPWEGADLQDMSGGRAALHSTGAMVDSENAYSIVKCAFKDNPSKPRTVTDVKLSVNVPLAGGIGDQGFSQVIGILTSILDNAGMDYRFIENRKEEREFIIREYEETDIRELPDEHYRIRLCHYDEPRLSREREAFEAGIGKLSVQITEMEELLEGIYQESKSFFKASDFKDLLQKNKSRFRGFFLFKTPALPPEENGGSVVLDPGELEEKGCSGKEALGEKIGAMEERIRSLYGQRHSPERRIVEERLDFLKDAFRRLDSQADPRHIQSGLLLDIDLTFIKTKKTTLNGITAVLRDFLPRLSREFLDFLSRPFAPAPAASSQDAKPARPAAKRKPKTAKPAAKRETAGGRPKDGSTKPDRRGPSQGRLRKESKK